MIAKNRRPLRSDFGKITTIVAPNVLWCLDQFDNVLASDTTFSILFGVWVIFFIG